MLKVHNINKSVHGKQILHSISFSVPRRSVAVFLGGSGAGKTTLLRVLNNLEPFDSGVIELDGKTIDLQRVGSEHVVGMVFQHFNLFEHLSVRRNITLPLVQQKYTEQEACCIADSLLKKYGLFEKANEGIANLSGGQKQRLAIARSIALNPQIICLDEPTSALDPILTSQVAQYVQDLASENRVVLLTTHDMNLIEKLDCLLFFMQSGSLVEASSTEAYRNAPEKYPHINSFLHI